MWGLVLAETCPVLWVTLDNVQLCLNGNVVLLLLLSMHVYMYIRLGKFDWKCITSTSTSIYYKTKYDGNVRVPSKVRWVGKEDACTWDGGRSGCLQVANLKHQSHGGWERDSLIACKGQHLPGWKYVGSILYEVFSHCSIWKAQKDALSMPGSTAAKINRCGVASWTNITAPKTVTE